MNNTPFTVKWLDHYFDDAEVAVKDLKKVKPMEHTTHGHLVFENRQMIVVCQTAIGAVDGAASPQGAEDGRFAECVYIIKKLITYRSDKQDKVPTNA